MQSIRHAIVFFSALAAVVGGPGLAGIATQAGAQQPAEQAAAVRTVRFAVQNMTCALCPITVRTAMRRVQGVRSVTVDLDAGTATVEYDPALATLDAIAAASTDAGYPARPAG